MICHTVYISTKVVFFFDSEYKRLRYFSQRRKMSKNGQKSGGHQQANEKFSVTLQVGLTNKKTE